MKRHSTQSHIMHMNYGAMRTTAFVCFPEQRVDACLAPQLPSTRAASRAEVAGFRFPLRTPSLRPLSGHPAWRLST